MDLLEVEDEVSLVSGNAEPQQSNQVVLSNWDPEVPGSSMDFILSDLGEVLDAQVKQLSRSKRDLILASMRERLQQSFAKAVPGQSGNSQLTLCERFQMSAEELLEFIPIASAHSQVLTRLSASLCCEKDEVESVIKGKLETLIELENRLAVLRSEVKLEALRNAKREEALLAQIQRHQDQEKSLPGPSQAEPMFMETPTGLDVRRKDENCRTVREQYRSLKKLSVEDNLRGVHNYAQNAGRRSSRQQESRGSSRSSRNSSLGSTIGESVSVMSGSNRSGHSGHSVMDMFSMFKEVFKSQSVASVPRYTGSNSLSDFLRALEVKFPPAVWQDSDRRDLLINHLEGTAKAVYRSLPRSVREGSYKGLVEALELARRNPYDQLNNIREWDQLSKRSEESVVEFCCRMEDLSRRIHPSCEWDFIRGSKLYSCLESWQDSYHMLAALDAPEGKVYEAVKMVARRLEKLQENVPTHTNDFHGHAKKSKESYKQTTWEEGRPASRSKRFGSPNISALRCFSCGEVGHMASKCGKRSTNAPLNRFKQGIESGGKYDQPGINAVGGITLADDVDGWCMTVRPTPPGLDSQRKAMGEPCSCSANARKRTRRRKRKPGRYRNETRIVNVRTNAIRKDHVSMFDQSPQGSSYN